MMLLLRLEFEGRAMDIVPCRMRWRLLLQLDMKQDRVRIGSLGDYPLVFVVAVVVVVVVADLVHIEV